MTLFIITESRCHIQSEKERQGELDREREREREGEPEPETETERGERKEASHCRERYLWKGETKRKDGERSSAVSLPLPLSTV